MIQSTKHNAGTLHRAGVPTRRRTLDAAALPHATPVAPGIFLLTPTVKGFALENVLLIQDEVTVLVDTGLTLEQITELRDAVDLVVNTHAHCGHSGKDYLFEEVWTLEASAEFLRSFDGIATVHGLRGTPAEASWREAMIGLGIRYPARVARRFAEGDVLDFGRTQWQVILAPGHSPDHCCLYEPNLKLLFASDVTLSSFGPWYGSPPSDIASFQDSIKRLMELDLEIIATSAKGPYSDGIPRRLQDFFDHFDIRDRRILALLSEARTIDELVDRLPIHGSIGNRQDFAQMILFSEQMMIEKHVARLMAKGLVARRGNRFKAK